MEHKPCQCHEPCSNCPKYGFMKGRKWEVCQGKNITEEKRQILLTAYQKSFKQPNGPTLIEKAINFGTSMISEAITGFQGISDEDYKKRMDICKDCEKFNQDKTCQLCGCDMTLKAKLATAACPDNPPKWTAFVTVDELLEKVRGGGCCGGN